MSLLACALVLAARSGELFQLPKIRSVVEEPPAGCDRSRKRAAEILAEIEREIPAATQAVVREVAADLEPGDTPAEGWDQAAALAVLNADPATALWAELQALALQWDTTFATNAGIYLYDLDKHDDAKLFLHCAYDMGARSPFLLEALANVYRKTGDKEKARIFVGEAAEAAPEDPFIGHEKSVAETGRPPPPPPPQAADPFERALAELERHQRRVLAAIHQALELRDRVNVAGGESEMAAYQKKANRESLVQLGESYKSGRDSVRSLLASCKDFSGENLRIARNSIAYTLVTLYIGTTDNLFTMTGFADNPWSGGSTLDMCFWGEVLGFEPVQLTRMFRALNDFEYHGHRAGHGGARLDVFGGAPFQSYSDQAAEDRTEGQGKCLGAGSAQAEEACRLAVDRQYCATMRELFRDYVDESERWFQRAARRFDRVAERRIAWAGVQVEDAFAYASTCAKEMRIPPADTQGKDLLKAMQASYLALLDSAVGGGREGGGSGPGYLVQHEAESYRLQRQDAEERHTQLASTIEDTCEPVDRKVLEQLAEEQRKAVQAMLLERLLHDFDAEWDPTMSCSVKLGEHFQVGIDDTGKLSVGGKWNWLKNKYPSADHVPDEVELARNYKFNIKDGAFVGATAGVESSGKYGPFTGKGSMTMGVAWNSKKNDWDFPVELGGTLGIGFATQNKDPKQNFSAVCYPGKARIKFEARAVARDAYEYVRSLDPD